MIIKDLLSVVLFLALFLIAGKSILIYSKYKFLRTNQTLLAIYLGLYVYVLIFHTLGLVHLLTRENLLYSVIFLNLACLAILTFKKTRIDFFGSWLYIKVVYQQPLLTAVVLFMSLLVLRESMLPIDGFDALAYHLYSPYVSLYHQHAFNAQDLIPNSGLPLGTDSIYGWLSLLGSPKTASLFNVFYVASALIITAKIFERGSQKIKFLALTSLFSLMTILGPVFSEPGTDLPLIPLGLMILSLILEPNTESKSVNHGFQQILIPVFLGLMAITKPSVIIFTAIYFLFSFYNNTKPTTIFKFLLLSCGPLVAWFLKNYLQSGNPFLPFATHIFKGDGYGPEILSTESDVRSSYNQVFRILTQRDSYHFLIDPTRPQNLTVLVFILAVALFISTVKHLSNKPKGITLGAILIAEIITLIVSGPIFRYFSYLLSMHLVLLIYLGINQNKRTSKDAKSVGSLSRISNQFTAKRIGVIMTVFGALNLMNTPWSTAESSQRSETNTLSSGSEMADKAILYVRNEVDENSNVCLIGDSRAMLFWPSKIFFLQANRINPFSDPEIGSNEQVISRLKEIRCDYLVLTTKWGFPKNMSLTKITVFVEAMSEIIENDFYSVYNLSQLEKETN
jgi:hypothetical protein